jgi:hypothetical protein
VKERWYGGSENEPSEEKISYGRRNDLRKKN